MARSDFQGAAERRHTPDSRDERVCDLLLKLTDGAGGIAYAVENTEAYVKDCMTCREADVVLVLLADVRRLARELESEVDAERAARGFTV